MYQNAYGRGKTFEEFLDGATANRDMWHAMAARTRVDTEAAERVRRLPQRWRLLVLADDWCGDAVNILPVVSRLASGAGNLDLRVVGRDEAPGLMDRHLTNGSRSIPVVIALDERGACRGWWGPRPRDIQAWFDAEGRSLPKEVRYRELRRRYARDRGVAVAREVAGLLECAAASHTADCGAVRPCQEEKAA